MAGMLQILTYMFAVYLVVKGIEVLQIALASNRESRTGIIIIGIVTLTTCVLCAATLVQWQDKQAQSIGRTMEQGR